MAENTGFSLPSGFGGLVSYKEEYASRFMLKPTHIIAFIVLIVAVRFALPLILGTPVV
jgi:preprotein translocase subunit Sec61beta